MIEKVNLNDVEKKPLNEMHGEKVLYQLVWRFTPKAEMLKAFKGVSKTDGALGGDEPYAQPPEGGADLHCGKRVWVIQVGEERVDVVAGDVVYLPANVPHGFFNMGKVPAVVLNIGAGIA